MQPVEGAAAAAVGGLADHDVVLAVVLGDERAVAVLAVEDRVVGGGLLEPVLVEDGDVRIDFAPSNSRAAGRRPRRRAAGPCLHGHLVVVDVLREDDAFDGAVELDWSGRGRSRRWAPSRRRSRTGSTKNCRAWERAGLRAHAHEVVAERDLRADGEGELDLAGRDGSARPSPGSPGV